MNVLVVMMAGSGTRFGASIPKQYTYVDNKPIFLPIVEHYANLHFIDALFLVCSSGWIKKVKDWTSHIKKHIEYVEGGRTRSHSVKNALDAISKIAHNSDVILIHDATQPYLDVPAVVKVIEATKTYGSATLASFGYDTVYQINEDGLVASVLQRNLVINGASPEAFLFSVVYDLYKEKSDDYLEKMTSAGAMVLSSGKPIKFVNTELLNLKITFQRDFELYQLLGEQYFYPRY